MKRALDLTHIKVPITKIGLGLCTLALASVGTAHVAYAANTAQIDEGVYRIVSKSADKSLDLHGASIAAGTNAEIYQDTLGHNQLFRITKHGKHYSIVHSISGMSLDVVGQSTKPEANVALWNPNGQTNQQWDFIEQEDGSYTIKSVQSGNVLDVMYNSKANGANVCVYSENGADNQRWELEKVEPVLSNGVYNVSSAANDKAVFDVAGFATADKATVGLWNNNLQTNQRFTFKYDAKSGYYKAFIGYSNKCLSVSGGKLVQENPNDSYAQLWRLGKNEDGSLYLLNASSSTFVTINGRAAAGTALVLKNGQNGTAQNFNFKSAEAASIQDGLYQIAVSYDTSKVLDVSGYSTSRNAQLVLWDNKSGFNQMWYIKNQGDGYISIQNAYTQLYLADANGTLVHEGSVDDASKWQAIAGSAGYAFKNAKTGKVLDVFGQLRAAGTKITSYSENFGGNQSFVLTKTQLLKDGTYTISSASANVQVIDVPGASKSSNTELISWEQNGGTNQAWVVKNTSDGYVTLTNKNSGMRLAAKNGDATALTPVVQARANDNDNTQKWRLTPSAQGGFQIWSKDTNVAIGVEGSRAYNGGVLKLFHMEDDPTMSWNFSAYDGSVGTDVKDWWGDPNYINQMRARVKRLGSDTNYSIMVDTAKWRLTVFKRTGSNWSLVRSMPCVVGDRTFRGDRKVYIVARALWKEPNGINVNDFYIGYVENWIKHPEDIDPRDGKYADRWDDAHQAYDAGQGIHFGVVTRSRSGCVVINYYNESKWLYDHITTGTRVSIF